MTDSGISSIDRIFDLVDSVVDKTDRIINRGKYTEEQHRTRRAKRQVVIDTSSAVKVARSADDRDKTAAPATSTTALATRRFHIVEAIDASTKQTIFVVTNGGSSRAECSTRELAEKILRALESTP